MQLAEQCPVLAVRLGVFHEADDGGVFELPGPGIADGPLVGGGGCQADFGEVVAVGEVGQHEAGIDGGDHTGHFDQALAVCGDDLGHGPGLDGVPQFDDGRLGFTVDRKALQFWHQVLAQGAAGAVVHQGSLAVGKHPGGVTCGSVHRALLRRGQVVVQRDAVRHVLQ